jgi:hypothetical protein
VTLAVVFSEDCALDAAVSVIVPADEGAVQAVVAPPDVWAGLNEPHGEGEQVQSTPALALSFKTVAATVVVLLISTVEAGAVVSAIESVVPAPPPAELLFNEPLQALSIVKTAPATSAGKTLRFISVLLSSSRN